MVGFKQLLEFVVDVDDKATNKFKQMGTSADKSLDGITTKTKGIGGAFESAAAKSPLLTGALDKVGLSGAQAGSLIQSALPGAMLVAGGAVAAFGVQAVGKFQELGGKVLDFQRIVGSSAEESSAFVAVLDDYAVSAEFAALAIGRMARKAEVSPAVFEKFGIEIAKNTDGTTNLQETLLNAAEAYQSTGDHATKAALGAALFGRGYAEIIPILEKGKDGADGLATAFANVEGQQILSQDQIDQAEETRLALDRLKDVVGEVTLAFGSGLSPAVGEVADLLSGLTEAANAALEPVGGLDQAVGFMVNSALKGGPVLSTLSDGLFDLALGGDEATSSMEALAGIAGGDWTTGMSLAGQATDEAAQSLAFGLTPAHVINAVALENTKTATDALTSALDAQKAAQDALLDSVNAGLSADLAYRNSIDATEDAVLQMNEASALGAEGAEVLDDATRGAESAILAEASAAVLAAEKQAELSGVTLSAAAKANIQRQALEDLKNKFPELSGVIQGYINKLNAIPTKIHTNFTSTVHAPGGGQATGGTFEDGEIRHAATGVTFLHVGEQGPEDVALFGNGRVLNRADTMAAASGGGGVSLTWIVNGGIQGDEHLRSVAKAVLHDMARELGARRRT